MSSRVIIDELEFDVPYGKLAAKAWYEETEESKRVLLLHGWMDNAGSFDSLVPHMKHPKGLYIVGIDLPGHGKSSQVPPGATYYDMKFIMEIRRCLLELKWCQPKDNVNSSSKLSNKPHKKFSIIGHSLGAGLAMFYASLYPEDVDEVISLDFIKPQSPEDTEFVRRTAETIDRYIETVPGQSPFSSPVLSKNTSSPSAPYTKQPDKGQVVVSHETAVVATIEAHKPFGVLTRENALALLKRSTVAVSTPPNSVIYSRDLRLNSLMNLRESYDIYKVVFSRVACHVLMLLGKQGMYAKDPLFRDRMDESEVYLKSKAKTFNLQWVEGDHFFHMADPKVLADIINKYYAAPEEYKVPSN